MSHAEDFELRVRRDDGGVWVWQVYGTSAVGFATTRRGAIRMGRRRLKQIRSATDWEPVE